MIIKPFEYPFAEKVLVNRDEKDVSLCRIIGISGPVGSGKSTFIKLLADRELHSVGVADDIPFAAYLSQDLTRLFTGNTLQTILYLYSDPVHEVGRYFNMSAFEEYADRLELPWRERRNGRINFFSEGELQRIAIALAFATEAELTILDEPTTALNSRYAGIFYQLAKSRSQQTRILFVSHRFADLRALADAVIWIENMRLETVFMPKDLLENQNLYRYFRPELKRENDRA